MYGHFYDFRPLDSGPMSLRSSFSSRLGLESADSALLASGAYSQVFEVIRAKMGSGACIVDAQTIYLNACDIYNRKMCDLSQPSPNSDRAEWGRSGDIACVASAGRSNVFTSEVTHRRWPNDKLRNIALPLIRDLSTCVL